MHTARLSVLLLLLAPAAWGQPAGIAEPNLAFDGAVAHWSLAQAGESRPGLWLLLFYSPWCPSCRELAPQWSLVARGFKQAGQLFAGLMFGATNCVAEPELQRQFRVRKLPTVLALHVTQAGQLRVLQQHAVRDGEGPPELLKWLGQTMRQSRHFKPQGHEIDRAAAAVRALARSQPVLPLSRSRLPEAASRSELQQVIHTAAYVSIDSFHLIDESERLSGERWAALREWLWLLGVSGAVRWRVEPADGISRAGWEQLVPRPVGELSWGYCSGTGHGYPCGLWLLLHVMAAEARSAPERAFKAIRGYISRFMLCAPCAQHFVKAADRVERVDTHRQLVIWLWRVHNSANVRTIGRRGAEEAPLYPSVALCPTCRSMKGDQQTDRWDEHEVFGFLQTTYSVKNDNGSHVHSEL